MRLASPRRLAPPARSRRIRNAGLRATFPQRIQEVRCAFATSPAGSRRHGELLRAAHLPLRSAVRVRADGFSLGYLAGRRWRAPVYCALKQRSMAAFTEKNGTPVSSAPLVNILLARSNVVRLACFCQLQRRGLTRRRRIRAGSVGRRDVAAEGRLKAGMRCRLKA